MKTLTISTGKTEAVLLRPLSGVVLEVLAIENELARSYLASKFAEVNLIH